MTKLYKVTITGWVVQDDFIDIPPSEWGTDTIVKEMMGEHIDEVLVDTIENNFDVPLKETPEAVSGYFEEVKADYEIFKNHWVSIVWDEGKIVRTDTYTTYKEAHDYALDDNVFLAGDEQGGYSICRYSHIPTTITVDWDHLIKGDA